MDLGGTCIDFLLDLAFVLVEWALRSVEMTLIYVAVSNFLFPVSIFGPVFNCWILVQFSDPSFYFWIPVLIF